MLKLSTKSSYGLRACLTLAQSDQLLSSTEIAERDNIPRRYLEQILAALRQSGLIISTRGAKGGFSLGRPPQEITIADIVTGVEGELPPMLCTNPDLRSQNCRHDSTCDCRDLCSDLETSVNKVLAGTTLAHILSRDKSLINTITGDAHGGDETSSPIFASLATETDTR